MKFRKIYDFFVTALIIPLWLIFFTEIIKEIPWLIYPAFGITSLILLVMIIPAVGELIRIIDGIYKFHCRRMDKLVLKTRKKLQRTISKTRNISVRNYAFDRLREVCPQETYIEILNDMAVKEKKSNVKEIIDMRKEQEEIKLSHKKLTGDEK